jgi:hypothetical protein
MRAVCIVVYDIEYITPTTIAVYQKIVLTVTVKQRWRCYPLIRCHVALVPHVAAARVTKLMCGSNTSKDDCTLTLMLRWYVGPQHCTLALAALTVFAAQQCMHQHLQRQHLQRHSKTTKRGLHPQPALCTFKGIGKDRALAGAESTTLRSRLLCKQ